MAIPSRGRFCAALITVSVAFPAPVCRVWELTIDVKLPSKEAKPASRSHVKAPARMLWSIDIASSSKSILIRRWSGICLSVSLSAVPGYHSPSVPFCWWRWLACHLKPWRSRTLCKDDGFFASILSSFLFRRASQKLWLAAFFKVWEGKPICSSRDLNAHMRSIQRWFFSITFS